MPLKFIENLDLRQYHIDDLPVNKALTLHLNSDGIAFDLPANGKAIDTAIAQTRFAIFSLRRLLLKLAGLFLHDQLYLVFDYCIDITALNDEILNEVLRST